MLNLLSQRNDEQEESHWLSISDLMAGLMIVFLFIAIALMRHALHERDKIKQVAVAYQENQVAIFDALKDEFKNDLSKWNAEIDDETLTFTFKSPDVLFQSGESDLNEQYRDLLNAFFPRYMQVLSPFKSSINEVRIEGHTSSAWSGKTDDEAYFENMRLSQERTRAVLQYVYLLPPVNEDKNWVKKHIAAVGLSSARLVYFENGNENKEASRRVSFRVITNSDIQIKRILEGGQ
jgi:outer membrane protein OmpA-like peptidoglycan-associated protein